MSEYVLGIDQSTQGTKALLFDLDGKLVFRVDRAHRQIVNDSGWVEHDPNEIFANVIGCAREVIEHSGVRKSDVRALGISNQRETSLVWDSRGEPVCNAIVWQDSRAEDVCARLGRDGLGELVREKSGLPLSPYFPAAKFAWILENVAGTRELQKAGRLRLGTVDTFLVYRLTHGVSYKTDFSNASRTELFDISKLCWDPTLCDSFGVEQGALPEICDSDSCFGWTDLDGFLDEPIPIHGVLGDSHAALLAQGCLSPGMVKATYGTGSSVMMNVGKQPVRSESGLASSLAWKLGGSVDYVLEGNINYSGAVITWLKEDLGLISSPAETSKLAREASKQDHCYLVPAFSGLGAPYWDSDAVAVLYGMTRTTKRAEIVRAALDCIAYQISDVLGAMSADARSDIAELRVDGGATANEYLMQFQSDVAGVPVVVSPVEELSGMGAAIAAGMGLEMYNPASILKGVKRTRYCPVVPRDKADALLDGWHVAVSKSLSK